MFGELSTAQIEEVLTQEYIGRIGCQAQGRIYVVPISYVYEGDSIYAHSPAGLKIKMMRQNPEVCFEVEQISDLLDWRSVIVWGRFEELHGEAAEQAMRLLIKRLGPHMPQEPADEQHSAQHDAENPERMPVLYRIQLWEKTGRYEPGPW